jgi:hypothetical protein
MGEFAELDFIQLGTQIGVSQNFASGGSMYVRNCVRRAFTSSNFFLISGGQWIARSK